MAVWSNDPNVDPVGACVGMNGAQSKRSCSGTSR